MNPIVQYIGESRWDAIVNSFSLDINDESSFQAYLMLKNVSVHADDHSIETAYRDWFAEENYQ